MKFRSSDSCHTVKSMEKSGYPYDRMDDTLILCHAQYDHTDDKNISWDGLYDRMGDARNLFHGQYDHTGASKISRHGQYDRIGHQIILKTLIFYPTNQKPN